MNIGVLGGGQLGRMLALVGMPLGHRFVFFDEKPATATRDLGRLIVASWGDDEALARFAQQVDLVTYEFENVTIHSLQALQTWAPVRPGIRALEVSQDRLTEKAFLQECGLPVAPHMSVESLEDLRQAATTLGLPAVLKTRRMGYDGKGQLYLRHEDDLTAAWEHLGPSPLILEGFVPFTRELSTVAARTLSGDVVTWPMGVNVHRDSILHECTVPAPDLSAEVIQEARSYMRTVLEALNYVGVLAIEWFQTPAGLVANEIAPRVHNSGHWSQDGATISQFEGHVRAITGMPLSQPELVAPTRMVNLIGEPPDLGPAFQHPGAHVHLYDKKPRPGRKIGHVNLVGEPAHQVLA